MFINAGKLEGVLKKAYKGAGIHLERQDSRLIVATAYMYIEADIEKMTNEFKAAVILFAGELPGIGEALTVTEDMSQNNVPKSYDRVLFTRDITGLPLFRETDFTYKGNPVLQSGEGKLIVVPAKEWSVYMPLTSDEREDDPDGWFESVTGIICRNSTMVLEYNYIPADDTLAALEDKRLI